MPSGKLCDSCRSGLDPSDLCLLVVLGAVHGARTPFEDIVFCARMLSPCDWQPTEDVLHRTLSRPQRGGLLATTEAGDPAGRIEFSLTQEGLQTLRRLLRKSVPTWQGGLTRACAAAKIGFIDVLDETDHRQEIGHLCQHYRTQLAILRSAVGRDARLAACRNSVVGREIARLESEIVWLTTLESDASPASGRTPVAS